MNDYEPFEMINQLRSWVNKNIASMENESLTEIKTRYRTILKIIEGYEQLQISMPKEIVSEKNELEEIIKAPSDTKNHLIDIANELSALSKEIKFKLRKIHSLSAIGRKKSPPKKIQVTLPDGSMIFEKNATTTFVKTIEFFGLEKVSELTSILAFRYPLVSKQKNKFGRGVWKVGDYYVETNSSTETKAKIINRIGDLLGINVSVKVID